LKYASGCSRDAEITGRYEMTWLYVLSGLIAVGLLIYLVAALLMAEDL
jgi:K+-transporting ATPase KdpF subunit